MNKRYVFDTNVLVSSAIFKKSIPRQAFDLALSKGQVIMSKVCHDEFIEVLMRSKFDKYLSIVGRTDFIQFVEKGMLFLEYITPQITACRDFKDNKYLDLATQGNAECIITGDADLLVLHPFQNISIVQPAVFLEMNV